MTINPVRHLEHFSPAKFGDTRVDVIGAGATGGWTALLLAKLGVINLHVWDFDKVEDHNLANQAYGPKHVGMYKVDALDEVIESQTGIKINKHNEKLEAGNKDLGQIVFLLVDRMDGSGGRKALGEKCIYMNFKTRLMVETRMGAEQGMIYTIDVTNGIDFAEWQKTLYSDKEAETSVCGAATTVGMTAMRVASDAVWQMLYWLKEGKIENHEILFSMRPQLVMPKSFAKKVETPSKDITKAA